MSNQSDLVTSDGLSGTNRWIQLSEFRQLGRNARRSAARAEMQTSDERRRIVVIEAMVADMEKTANQLNHEIEAEQVRTSIHDPAHYAYSTYAKAAMARRDNLRHSIQKLQEHIGT